ncbi:penicillin acylase family protein [Rhodohalobacter sp. SW132]|uniref:penicillin acylase family protein n=1 Tax=Rhodohalobacter sp. SW132 TaxID=2293433 RepID=UPI000E27BCA0|nr:penicillin acylase family protein [Rhodohalobacter sp. SW132]REL38386.1 penicillin acylase family protein [Rhodohalobacter sp. SW132]
MRNIFSFLVVLLITALTVFLLSIPLGPLPPAGAFFQPTQGFWANAETRSVTGELNLNEAGLNEPVDVFFDERGVPHIFAENDEDLYFAQGYVTARDRLFQMELQIRAAGGKLAEWLGPDLIEHDRHQRRLGMLYGAEQAMEKIGENDTVRTVIEAYAAGVNAYINTLTYESYPLEYKILNVKPAGWEPINTALLLKYMTQMLAGRSDDFRTSNTMAYFGEEFVDEFLSTRPSLMDPIIPPETEWEFSAELPERLGTLYQAGFTEQIEPWQPDPLNGSNNWVVDGSKTEGGYPILSNDMHLNMSLPSIWYEVQLRTPDSNVYGVSLQGTPTVIVGFNEQIAWGSTNTGADVMDWYEITFRDESKNEYLHDGEWKQVSLRTETIAVKGREAVTDTIRFTHHGPVYETEQETPVSQTIQHDHALRWIAHDPSNELITFYMLNRAGDVDDFREAFRNYQAPAQNMNYAGVDGNIAMQTGGRFPLKWEYQGRTVSDGSDSRYDWGEYIPFEQNPYSINPERGFLSAANQFPTAENYPHYLGEAFAPYERGRRINDLLRDMNSITVQDFDEMLMDEFSYHAYTLLPVLLEHINESALDDSQSGLLNLLRNWNYQNTADQIEPSVFRQWWLELNRAIWDNKYDTEFPMRRPDRDKTVDLITQDPDSDWFNNVDSNERETLADLALSSFTEAIDHLSSRYGEPGEPWHWGYVNRTPLNHIGQIPGMGIENVFTGGGAESINAIRGSHGPSWRMVMVLDPAGVRGYGVYPGGQSGNPGSKTYDEFVEIWQAGGLYELQFLREKPSEKEGFPLIIRFE